MAGTDKQNGSKVFLRWLFACVMGLSILFVTFLGVLTEGGNTVSVTHRSVGISSEELIALIVSLVVVMQVTASFKSFKRIPHKGLLFGSFAAMVLSAIFTVAEGIVFGKVMNYFEHLSFMISAVLLAFWCALMFGPQPQERA